MDPVTVGAVILAIVSGASGEVGAKLWDGLVALVRRPFRARPADMPAGTDELAALERAPANEQQAIELARALIARAEADATWREDWQAWWQQATSVRAEFGNVTNTVRGGTQHGPVLQGRDFSGLTFNTGPQPPLAG